MNGVVRLHELEVKGNDLIRLILPTVLVALLSASGCETRKSPPRTAATGATSVASTPSSATIERVRKIVSEQMGVSLDKIMPTTSLGDLAADELDFVELIMELEESFSITISDDKAEALTGNADWQKGMNNVTIEKLSTLVNDCGK
jgi:acyl carrier protein